MAGVDNHPRQPWGERPHPAVAPGRMPFRRGDGARTPPMGVVFARKVWVKPLDLSIAPAPREGSCLTPARASVLLESALGCVVRRACGLESRAPEAARGIQRRLKAREKR